MLKNVKGKHKYNGQSNRKYENDLTGSSGNEK